MSSPRGCFSECNSLELRQIYENPFLFYNTIALSGHEQVCLSRLRFEKYFSLHREKDLSKRNLLKHTCSWLDKLIVLWKLNRSAEIFLRIPFLFVRMVWFFLKLSRIIYSLHKYVILKSRLSHISLKAPILPLLKRIKTRTETFLAWVIFLDSMIWFTSIISMLNRKIFNNLAEIVSKAGILRTYLLLTTIFYN